EIDFYTATASDGGKDDRPEALLSKLESAAAGILRAQTPPTLSEEERITLAYFLAAMMVRVPAMLDTVKTFLNDVQSQWLRAMKHTLRTNRAAFDRMVAEHKVRTGEDLSSFKQEDIDD